MGKWIDGLAKETSTGAWQIFGTATFRTPNYPWQRGFPMGGSYKPSVHFVHKTFDQTVKRLEDKLAASVDYFVADQLGSANQRLHQHFILAALGLDRYPRTDIWKFLFDKAGMNRILRFEQGAAFYIGKYIGRDVSSCDWDYRLASHPPGPPMPVLIGKTEIVRSVDAPKDEYKRTVKGWHR
jgi:hypothetical protein